MGIPNVPTIEILSEIVRPLHSPITYIIGNASIENKITQIIKEIELKGQYLELVGCADLKCPAITGIFIIQKESHFLHRLFLLLRVEVSIWLINFKNIMKETLLLNLCSPLFKQEHERTEKFIA
jgi:hypothetical protein